ncbi:serine hydrolase domain-containing protein [Brachybacterium sp. AOP25-B2-12]|uniref:serine hydrolase domain-containing protein n=1 Tax=Brachybacterium sp. AOP25-B2-12 TaxID=3457710 RepID=UPI0040339BF0
MPHIEPSVPSSASPRPTEESVDRITELFAGAVADDRTAGITWALVGGHDSSDAVLAAGAAGDAELHDGTPGPAGPMAVDSISRIASMTKSFTAATILALRDEGRIALDAPVATYVPEAAGITPATPDSPAITLRHLLTMSAGLVTDNPWGDRQEAMTPERFAEILHGDLGHVHAPGTGFEYSNTGFALLGRVIDEVTGTSYRDEIARRFLAPLGLADTGFSLDGLDRGRVAIGHRIADRTDRTRFEPVPFDAPGVYGAMAGLYSTTADVARWVRFLAAADAPDAAGREQSLLSTGSRREMQQMHRVQELPPLPAGPDGVSPGFDRIRAYGFGLVVERFPDLGEVVSHSGGYPGYGSFMCWHRDSGVGVVALANAKYAPASTLSIEALRVLRTSTDLLARRPVTASPRALEAAAATLTWLRGDDDALADAWFADNMDLDVSRGERRRRLGSALATARVGREALDALRAEDASALSRAHLRWEVPGAAGSGHDVRIDLLLDPRRDALIQAIEVTSVAATARS